MNLFVVKSPLLHPLRRPKAGVLGYFLRPLHMHESAQRWSIIPFLEISGGVISASFTRSEAARIHITTDWANPENPCSARPLSPNPAPSPSPNLPSMGQPTPLVFDAQGPPMVHATRPQYKIAKPPSRLYMTAFYSLPPSHAICSLARDSLCYVIALVAPTHKNHHLLLLFKLLMRFYLNCEDEFLDWFSPIPAVSRDGVYHVSNHDP